MAGQYRLASAEEENAKKARQHADSHLLISVVEAWAKVLPYLKYAARNERVLAAALNKRDVNTLSSFVHMFALNCMRKRDQRSQTDRAILLMAWCT